MPRWKTPRWTLGAPALVALAVAGCGAAASPPRLRNTAEKQLLSLVARAQADAAAHRGTAVDAALGRFVADVRTLRSSGQLTGTLAGRLDREARRTAAEAVRQLRPSQRRSGVSTTTTQTTAAMLTATEPTGSTPQADGGTRRHGNGKHGWHGHGHGHGGGKGHGPWSADASTSSNPGAQWWSYVNGGGGD